MNLASKTFRNNKTGETVRVIDTFETIAILENKQKIDVRTLMDPNQFTEQIDPSSFFNNQDAYNILAEKIKTIPTDTLVDDTMTSNFGGVVQPAINESAIIQTTEEDEMAELARKYGADINSNNELLKQKEAFSKYLDDDTEITPVTRVEVKPEPVVRVDVTPVYEPPVTRVQVDDPITSMFKNVKRTVDFNISVDISNKIPRLDFIEMMEDSYEISIIDFLAEEFTNKVLSDPSQIRDMIKSEIKNLVYGPKKPTNGINTKTPKEKSTKKEVTKPKVKKTVNERIELISKLTSISNIEFQLKGEKSKSVIAAGNKRIEELKNKK